MGNKRLIYILFVLIPFILISCNSVKIKNRKINNNVEFQYEKNGALKRGYNYLSDRNDNFELIFLYRFNDSVFISSDTIELFTDKVVTNDITDNPNISFLLNVEKYEGRLINIKIPNKKIDENFYLSKRFKMIYFFYYEEEFIIRYSNKLYNVYWDNSNAPYGTYSHEFIHTLAVPDNGYNKGGVLNSPPQSLIPIEIDEIINKSVPAN